MSIICSISNVFGTCPEQVFFYTYFDSIESSQAFESSPPNSFKKLKVGDTENSSSLNNIKFFSIFLYFQKIRPHPLGGEVV